MKRLFSMLLPCFVNVPVFFIRWENVLAPAFLPLSFPLSLSVSFPLSISKAFLPVSRSSFFSVLSLSASLFNSWGSQSRTDSMLGEQNRAHCQWNWVSTFHLLSSSFSFLSPRASLWPTCLLVLFGGGCLIAGTLIFILLSSLFLFSPLQRILCSVEVWYIIPLGIQGGR